MRVTIEGAGIVDDSDRTSCSSPSRRWGRPHYSTCGVADTFPSNSRFASTPSPVEYYFLIAITPSRVGQFTEPRTEDIIPTSVLRT